MAQGRKFALRSDRKVVGWREWVKLPDLGVESVKAKVDTGARSSALHALDINIKRQRGVEVVTFRVHPLQDDAKTTIECRAKLLEYRRVKSSNGKTETRPVVLTHLALHGETWPVELTLTARDLMGFRMLLGRQAVRRRFVVDPGRSFLAKEFLPVRKSKKRKQ
ncbi:MAG: RimK/LysX family protein [Myxococcota bacterium]